MYDVDLKRLSFAQICMSNTVCLCTGINLELIIDFFAVEFTFRMNWHFSCGCCTQDAVIRLKCTSLHE